MTDDPYVLRRGEEGARRLAILSRAMWPSTRAFLRQIGVRPGLSCLDVGCGIGHVTLRIARRTGACLGVDLDEGFLARARAEADRRRIEGARFLRSDAAGVASLGETFDVAYARYLLTHLADPARALASMADAVRPGGVVAVEDVDFPLHFWHPRCRALERYVDLYQAVVRRRGGDPSIGRRLHGLFLAAGLDRVRVDLVVRVHVAGPGKRVAPLTLAHIGESAIAGGLSSREELDRLAAEIDAFVADPSTQVSIAPTFQVWGVRSGRSG